MEAMAPVLVQAERIASDRAQPAAAAVDLAAAAAPAPIATSRFMLHGGEHEVNLDADEQGAITLGVLNLRRCDCAP